MNVVHNLQQFRVRIELNRVSGCEWCPGMVLYVHLKEHNLFTYRRSRCGYASLIKNTKFPDLATSGNQWGQLALYIRLSDTCILSSTFLELDQPLRSDSALFFQNIFLWFFPHGFTFFSSNVLNCLNMPTERVPLVDIIRTVSYVVISKQAHHRVHSTSCYMYIRATP